MSLQSENTGTDRYFSATILVIASIVVCNTIASEIMAAESVPSKRADNLQNQTSESMLRNTHTVTIEDGEDGIRVVKCPELNVVTQGNTLKDAQCSAVDAIGLMREELGKSKKFGMDIRRIQ